ncbi:MAG: hypothetical protein M1820_008516 [Bogoriella megaspora]|nr:MAG: hypothetical protein M1820_008516 [Bogoriella megaspora]
MTFRDIRLLLVSVMSKVNGRAHDIEYPVWDSIEDPDCSEPEDGRSGFDIARVAASGCHLCKLLYSIASALSKSENIDHFKFASWLLFRPASLQPARLRFRVYQDIDHVVWETVSLFCDGRPSELRASTPTDRYSGNEDCTKILLDAISNCISTHERCKAVGVDKWTPSRLIDVGSNLDNNSVVFLVEKHDFAQNGPDDSPRYVTLSHIWGDDEICKLNSETWREFRDQGINVKHLPKYVQDAIYFVRQASCRYLWIDSLCILQDSETDWAAEAAMMHMVYSNGLCNLAACKAMDQSIGLWEDRDPTLSEASVLLQYLDTQRELIMFFDWYEAVEVAPLYKRAWVIQERLLGRRTIHFTQFPFFECQADLICEIYQNSTGSRHPAWMSQPRGIPKSLSRWNNIVYDYAHCALSKATDRLIALSGIAQRISFSSNGKYLAGVWSDNLHVDLLWQVKKRSTGHGLCALRGQTYIAPSWSWASVDEPVDLFLAHVSERLMSVIDASVRPVHDSEFGQIADGEIILSGHMFGISKWPLIRRSHESFRDSSTFDDWAWNVDDGDSDLDHTLR